MKQMSTKNIVLSGLFIALGMVLPFLTGQIPQIGSVLLPMHIPVLLCGFVCGWPFGLMVGFILPLLRSAVFTMPPILPTALTMAFELAAYGFLAGFMYRVLPRKNVFTYVTLIISMIGGRIVWGIISIPLYGLGGTPFTGAIFVTKAFVEPLPGIAIQLLIIPVMIILLRKGKYME